MKMYFQKRSNWNLSGLLWLLLAFGAGSAYAQDDELLPPEEAYAFEAVTTDQGIDANWTIADGYYMYRDKLSFSLQDADGNDIPLEYDFPKSKRKVDSFFGDVEVYYKQANFQIPLAYRTAPQDVVLTVKGQGCNDPIGVCYPPMTRSFPLTLASTAAAVPVTPEPAALEQAGSALQSNVMQDPQQDSQQSLGSLEELSGLLGVEVPEPAEGELLPADKAYAFDARVTGQGIDANWSIAKGYYMYRDKFSFELKDANGNEIPIDYDFPKSKRKSDTFFGDVDVYYKQANFQIPLTDAPQDVVLTIKGQGCNEPVGVCYPPIIREMPLSLVSSASAQISSPLQQLDPAQIQPQALSSIDDLRNLLGGDTADDALLPPDQAFKVTASTDQDNLVVQFEVADGYYLYKDKLKFSSDTHPLSKPSLPEGKLKEDAYFGASIVYRNAFDALMQASSAGDGDTLMLQAEYQGCADAGVCYPPQIKKFELPLSGLLSSANAQTAEQAQSVEQAKSAGQAQSSQLAANDSQAAQATKNAEPESAIVAPDTAPANTRALVSEGGPDINDTLWWVLGMAFLAGIGLTFTPCVLPMVPILSSVIGGQGPGITKKKAATLAAIYVLGTAVTYAAIGAVAGATGDQLQSYFQNVWAIGIMAAIFVLMALSMFGLFEIQLPSSIQSRLANTSQGIKGGSALWVFVLGLISALIVGACVSPVLISFLGLAIAKGSPMLGALTMFSMAMGMGIPLILLGMGAGHLIPKAGVWMDTVKYVFGVLLIGVAVYLLSVLPEVPILYFWAVLFIVVAIYMGATQSLPEGATGWSKLIKGLGTLILIWGVLALVGAIYGERDILKPLPSRLFSAAPAVQMQAGGTVALKAHPFDRVNTIEELDKRMAQAVRDGKIVMIDYYADWCIQCVKMEKTTFSDIRVRTEMANRFVALQVDVTDPKDETRKLLKKRFGVFGPPASLFFDAQGNMLREKNFYGYMGPDEFLALLQSM